MERISKKRFVVALTGEVGERWDRATLFPLIFKFIKPKTIIYSDAWAAYRGLEEHNNYVHKVINPSEHFVDPEDPTVHTQNIKGLWRDIKEWSKRPDVRSKFLHQYLARYLFVTSEDSDANLLHHFLKLAAQVYPPQSEPKQAVDVDRETELLSGDPDEEVYEEAWKVRRA